MFGKKITSVWFYSPFDRIIYSGSKKIIPYLLHSRKCAWNGTSYLLNLLLFKVSVLICSKKDYGRWECKDNKEFADALNGLRLQDRMTNSPRKRK